jgi:hypothetical protein
MGVTAARAKRGHSGANGLVSLYEKRLDGGRCFFFAVSLRGFFAGRFSTASGSSANILVPFWVDMVTVARLYAFEYGSISRCFWSFSRSFR